jgi:hypothetical protein
MPTDTSALKDKANATMDAAQQTAAAARDTAGAAAETAGSKLHEIGADLSARASDTAGQLRDAAASRIEGARGAIADAGDRLADTLRRAADNPGAPELQSRALTAMSDGASAVAGTLRERSFSEMASDVKALAQRNPAAFAAGAAVVGFALARMLRAHNGGARS